MNLVCLDFSENNLLAEQMNINSLFDLSVMNHTLFELQLKSISDLNSDTVYVLAQFNKIHNTIFKVECVDNNSILKALLELNKAQSVLLFRNDVYFENDFLQYEKLIVEDEILAFNNDIGECYAVITSVKRLIKFLNKNISLSHLITEAEKFADVFISPEGYKNIYVR